MTFLAHAFQGEWGNEALKKKEEDYEYNRGINENSRPGN
jgi:hypothetical protein